MEAKAYILLGKNGTYRKAQRSKRCSPSKLGRTPEKEKDEVLIGK